MTDWREVDMDDWPTVKYDGRAVTLDRGADFVCVSHDPQLPNSVTISGGSHRHVHLLTQSGLVKLTELIRDGSLYDVLRAQREARDPEKVAWRKDQARLKRIHAEGNG